MRGELNMIKKLQKDVQVNREKESTGRRTSNLSRDKGHLFKFVSEKRDETGSVRKRIVTLMDVATGKLLTRVGEASFKGGDIDVIKLVSLEGHEDVILARANMRKGKKLVVVNTGKVTPLMGYPIYALEGV
jgi:hypothetical protein